MTQYFVTSIVTEPTPEVLEVVVTNPQVLTPPLSVVVTEPPEITLTVTVTTP